MPKNEPVRLRAFVELAKLFDKHGFHAYLVGGSVRDFLIEKELFDMDVATDATPSEMKEFLLEADYTYEKYGSIKVRFFQIGFDVTTFRKEEGYSDHRHPCRVEFTRNIKEDVKRRDFTINALYLDKSLTLLDYVGGEKDIKNKLIRMVGNPSQRLKEDPLRIVRAIRFASDLDFEIEKSLAKAIEENAYLLKELNIEKIKEEVRKCHKKEKLLDFLKKVGIVW